MVPEELNPVWTDMPSPAASHFSFPKSESRCLQCSLWDTPLHGLLCPKTGMWNDTGRGWGPLLSLSPWWLVLICLIKQILWESYDISQMQSWMLYDGWVRSSDLHLNISTAKAFMKVIELFLFFSQGFTELGLCSFLKLKKKCTTQLKTKAFS